MKLDDRSNRCGTSGPTIQTCRCLRYVISLTYLIESRGFSLVGLTLCRCGTHGVPKVVSSTWRVKRSHAILVRPLKSFRIKVLVCLEMSRPSHQTQTLTYVATKDSNLAKWNYFSFSWEKTAFFGLPTDFDRLSLWHQYSDTSANEDFSCFWTRLTNMDSANECFSGCAR